MLADPLQLHVFPVCWNIEAVGKPGAQRVGVRSKYECAASGSVQGEGVHRERGSAWRGEGVRSNRVGVRRERTANKDSL